MRRRLTTIHWLMILALGLGATATWAAEEKPKEDSAKAAASEKESGGQIVGGRQEIQ